MSIKLYRIKAFIISRPWVRSIILFFFGKLFLYLRYSLYFLATLLVFAVIFLALFKQNKLDQITRTITNFVYKTIHFNSGYSEIKITGNARTEREQIASIAREYLLQEDISNQLLINSLKEKIEKLPWVDEVVITVTLEGSLYINVKEHQPFAIWEDDKGKYIVSKTGKLISFYPDDDFNDLIILTGFGAYKNVKSLFNILAIDPVISQNVYSATWIGNRRWDIRFKNGLLVKLPSNNSDITMSEAWKNLIEFYNTPGALIGLKMVDLRIAKKIYLQYDDSTTKEIIKSK